MFRTKKVMKVKIPLVKKKIEKKIKKRIEKKIKKKVELKSESYCGIKIVAISKREDGAYNVELENGTTTIVDQAQCEGDVK